MSLIDNLIERQLAPYKKSMELSFKNKEKKLDKKIAEMSKNDIKEYESGNWKEISIGDLNQTTLPDRYLEEFVSWNFANIAAIAEAVSEINLKLYQAQGDNIKQIEEHPILELMSRPNHDMTMRDFTYLMEVYLLLTGESPIRKRRSGKSITKIGSLPTELHLLDPTSFYPVVAQTEDRFEIITRYVYEDNFNGQTYKLDLEPQDVVFIKNPNPKNKWRGMGVVEAAQRSINIMHYSESYNENFFKNSAVPYTVLYTDQKLDSKIIERLKESWNAEYKTYKNAHKTAILEAGLKIERLQSNSKDMDFMEQQRFIRDKLMAMYKTTKIALGIVEDVNRANAEASEYVFMKNCVKPKMEQLVDALNVYLLPEFDKTGTLFFDFDNPVPEDREKKIQEYSVACDRWLSRNEIRALEGYEPIEGGDDIPLNNGFAVADKKKVPERLKQKAIQIKNRNIALKQAKEALKKELRKRLKNSVTKQIYAPMKYKDINTKEDTDLFIKSINSNSHKFEKKLDEIMTGFYAKQEKEIINNLNGKKSIKSADEYMFDQEASVKTGINLMEVFFESVLTAQGAEAMLSLSISKPYKLLEQARKFLNAQPAKLAKSITETAYIRIRKQLEEAIGKGESIPEMVKRIKDTYKDIKKYQAENIAISEVSRATNFATEDAYIQSGVVEGKEWVVVPDDRLCEFCMAMESTYQSKARLSQKFFKKGDTVKGVDGGEMELDYDDVNGPPLHPRCRCIIKAVFAFSKDEKPQKTKKVTTEDLLLEIDKELDGIKRAKTSGDEKETA